MFHGKFEYPFPRIFYFEEDVKEFIRLLKDGVNKCCVNGVIPEHIFNKVIDTLAGDDLK